MWRGVPGATLGRTAVALVSMHGASDGVRRFAAAELVAVGDPFAKRSRSGAAFSALTPATEQPANGDPRETAHGGRNLGYTLNPLFADDADYDHREENG